MKLNKMDSLILQTKHFTIKEAQTIMEKEFYIKRSVGFISQRRTELKEQALKILYEEAKNFPDNHLTRIYTLSYLLQVSLKNLKDETEPLKKQHIADSIAKLQFDIAAFDEATKGIIENNGIQEPKEEIIKDNERITKSIPIPKE